MMAGERPEDSWIPGRLNMNSIRNIGSARLYGPININAPVNGDVFVTGGQISINSDVKGKIVAAGGNIDLKGNARNVVAAGGNVNIHATAVISKDAFISGGRVSNAGKINGNLTVRAEKFQNTGSAGIVDFEKSEGMQGCDDERK